jgi:Asp/Glu/hydantoin racemase
MGRRVGLIHAISSNVRLFNDLTSEIMPGIEVVHFVDEGLPSLSGERSREQVVRRLKLLASFAEDSEAEAVMLTCTAFGRLVDEVEDAINLPVFAVLEIIADEAPWTWMIVLVSWQPIPAH